MNSNNSLFSTNYDPIVHLNELFEDDDSLVHLPGYMSEINMYNNKLFEEIKETEEQFNKNKARNQQDQTQLQDQMNDLIKEIGETRVISTKAEHSITTMTSAIKNLDQCKKNLVLTMTVFKRLQMLFNAHDSLERILNTEEPKNYEEIFNLISVVIELNNHFKTYKSIDEINLLSRSIYALKQKLAVLIFKDFDKLLNNDLDSSKSTNFVYGCKILDSYGESYRKKLVDKFCANQLREIKKIFGNPNDEAGTIENLSRRFIFFKKLLTNYNNHFKTKFPESWEVDKELALEFCSFNQKNINILLSSIDQSSNLNIELILKNLLETMEFENQLNQIFNKQVFTKKISVSFEPFLKIWLKEQEKLLNTKLLEFMSRQKNSDISNDKQDDGDSINVFTSSADLFRAYRQLLNQIIKVSNGEILLNLFDTFLDYLAKYLEKLLWPLIPNKVKDLEETSNEEALKYFCLIVNTAEYIITTMKQLEEMMESLITEEFKSEMSKRIQSSNIEDQYLDIINVSLNKILFKIELNTNLAFLEMLNNNWKFIDEVSDCSRYATNLIREISVDLRHVITHLNKSAYIRYILDKLVQLIISKFFISLVKLKPINDTMPSQILFDLSFLKKFFKTLPISRSDDEDISLSSLTSPNLDQIDGEHDAQAQSSASISTGEPASLVATSSSILHQKFTITKSYLNLLDQQFLKIEQVLKVLMINGHDSSALINNYLLILLDCDFENFAKILVLKGVITQTRPIHSSEKRELLKYRELFETIKYDIMDESHKDSKNQTMLNLIVDTSALPQYLMDNSESEQHQHQQQQQQLMSNFNGSFSNFGTPGSVASTPALRNFQNAISNSPIMGNLSPNLQSFIMSNKSINSPNFNRESFEKNFKDLALSSETSVKNLNENFKSNLGKFFRKND